jgi:uncharacterized protein (TIGR02118 family)
MTIDRPDLIPNTGTPLAHRRVRRRVSAVVKIIIMFKKRSGMSQEAFQAYRRDVHAPLLLAIPEAQLIRRFVVSYPVAVPGYPEPAYDAVVQAWFDSVEDLQGLFTSRNFLEKVDPDHDNFIDMESVVRIVTEEIVVVS